MFPDKTQTASNATFTATLLCKIAATLTSKRFKSWYSTNESRFTWSGSRLHKKLRTDLMCQCHQAFPFYSQPETDLETLHELGSLIAKLASHVESTFNVTIPVKDRKMTVPRGTGYQDALYALFTSFTGADVIKSTRATNEFYIWNAIHSLAIYVKARQTLSHSTGHPGFEEVLTSMTEDYLLAGYPHDLLSSDAELIREGHDVATLAMDHGSCSTWSALRGDKANYYEQGIAYHFDASKKVSRIESAA